MFGIHSYHSSTDSSHVLTGLEVRKGSFWPVCLPWGDEGNVFVSGTKHGGLRLDLFHAHLLAPHKDFVKEGGTFQFQFSILKNVNSLNSNLKFIQNSFFTVSSNVLRYFKFYIVYSSMPPNPTHNLNSIIVHTKRMLCCKG